jgi:aryl-alcohol dehydrogenase-like predicted oxidoreductase
VLIGKGAHTPHCHPEAISSQLTSTLERLRTEYLDVYLLHRDNPDIPVGEFIEALNEETRRGRIRVFGCSNWTVERIKMANAYAEGRGLAAFGASSVNFSLATWNEPWWEGCISASDAQSRNWYEVTQMPLLAWSSQASGFFAGDVSPETARSEFEREMMRVWWNPANVLRRQRTHELARSKGCESIQIALAYVLHQPLKLWALIGPRRPSETQQSINAFHVHLSPQEIRWLNADGEA